MLFIGKGNEENTKRHTTNSCSINITVCNVKQNEILIVLIKLRRDITFDTPARESRKRTNRRKIRKGRQSNIDGIVDNLPVSNILFRYNPVHF